MKTTMKPLCVLIPAHNESLVIAGTIQSMLDAGMRQEDIYLVDDFSDDTTGTIAASYGVNVLRNTVNLGKAMSVNALVTHFDLLKKYRYVSMMDADTLVNESYFKLVTAQFDTDPTTIAAVCGRPMSRPNNWITSYRCWEYFMTHYVYRGGQSNMGVIMVAPGCAATYRSDVFAQLEWNNDTRVEDMDVTIQVHRKHLGKIVYAPGAVVYTQDPNTLSDFVKQITRWHGGTWQVGMKYKMFTGTQRVDWEFKLLMIEGIIFSILFLGAPLWTLLYPTMLIGLGVDVGLIMAIAGAAAISDKRKDVFLYSPIFIFLRIVYCAIFLYSFYNIFVRKQKMQGWLNVKRYQQAETK
jgi:cellulose synthase/poly-beta-1,6-N-acetylglucosamine synthase-like glycosyltransferase